MHPATRSTSIARSRRACSVCASIPHGCSPARNRSRSVVFGCERWQLGAAIERATTITAERVEGADVSTLLDGMHVTAQDRRRLDRYGHGFSGTALTGFAALPLRRWPQYARSLVWPSAASLRDRQLTRFGHLRRLGGEHLPGT